MAATADVAVTAVSSAVEVVAAECWAALFRDERCWELLLLLLLLESRAAEASFFLLDGDKGA